MTDFELLERDGLARRGRLATPHGPIETPALLPVVHPDPMRQAAPPRWMRETFGLGAVITSAYITWRSPPLHAIARERGIHGLLDFDGPIMTDSGAFQQHAYGSVEITPAESLGFQETIGSDIATVLDVFTEPEAPREQAVAGLELTLERARAARAGRTGLLAVPVQGGAYPDLRARSAEAASQIGDVLAVGGVVPLLEQYRFVELVQAVAAARPHLAPDRAIHLFGAGHPMTFALGALLGVDLFDSSAYIKFARRGALLFPDGTVPLSSLRERICECALCRERPLTELGRLPAGDREIHLARHNLLTSAEEMARVRQAIREGTLWELVERRTTAHPALRAALRNLISQPELFLPTEPDRRRAFREVTAESLHRPAVVGFQRKVAEYRARRVPPRRLPAVPLRPEYLSWIPREDREGHPLEWVAATPMGEVPLELLETYPVGPFLGLAEFESPRRAFPVAALRSLLDADPSLGTDRSGRWQADWDRGQIRALLEWRYGPEIVQRLEISRLKVGRSRRTLRARWIEADGRPLWVVGNDGQVHPTYGGAEWLLASAPGLVPRVTVHPDAAEFVAAGRSLFSRFVVRADPSLRVEMTAPLVDPSDRLLAVGRLLLAPSEMGRMARGVAVRVTGHARSPPGLEPEPEPIGREE
ncbi:MAG: tRNA guanosine(15) transglycosylase TgtA [Thermoplasmata archaeon]